MKEEKSRYAHLNFDKIKEHLETLTSVEEVEEERVKLFEKYKNLSEKQSHAINRIFATRKDCIENPDGLPGWHRES
jgi:hypothetical protein